MAKSIVLFALLLSSCTLCQAQQDTTKTKSGFGFKQNPENIEAKSFWMEWAVGTGISSIRMQDFFRLSIGSTLSANWISTKYRMFSIRGGYHLDKGLMDGFMGSSSSRQQLGELGFQTGKTFVGKYMRTSLLFGVSSVFGAVIGEDYGSGSHAGGSSKNSKTEPFFSVGIPLTIKTSFAPKGFGFGVALDANLNPKVTYVTLKLNFIFGNIRKMD